LSFAFWPGGMKKACFFASLIISSVITLRLKRRKALSIDSPWLTVTTAIYFSNDQSLICVPLFEPLFNTSSSISVKQTMKPPQTFSLFAGV